METRKIANWVQIATGFGVLIGLGLVVWELQQSRAVATAQLTSDGFAHFHQLNISRMGESPATAPTNLYTAPELRDPVLLTTVGIQGTEDS